MQRANMTSANVLPSAPEYTGTVQQLYYIQEISSFAKYKNTTSSKLQSGTALERRRQKIKKRNHQTLTN